MKGNPVVLTAEELREIISAPCDLRVGTLIPAQDAS